MLHKCDLDKILVVLFCPDLMFCFLHAFVIGKELSKELHKKAGVQKNLWVRLSPYNCHRCFFYQISKNVCNNQIGLKIVLFHLEINYDTGIKHPAPRNITTSEILF